MKPLPTGLCAVALSLLLAAPVAAQTIVHGANSQFAGAGVKLAWAVDRGTSEDKATVVIRLLNIARTYRFLRVDGVDPFTKDRVVLVEPRPLDAQTDLAILRSRFADHPSAEIHLFATEDALKANAPATTVFYLGVPDTTPELPTGEGVRAYFDRMLQP